MDLHRHEDAVKQSQPVGPGEEGGVLEESVGDVAAAEGRERDEIVRREARGLPRLPKKDCHDGCEECGLRSPFKCCEFYRLLGLCRLYGRCARIRWHSLSESPGLNRDDLEAGLEGLE